MQALLATLPSQCVVGLSSGSSVNSLSVMGQLRIIAATLPVPAATPNVSSCDALCWAAALSSWVWEHCHKADSCDWLYVALRRLCTHTEPRTAMHSVAKQIHMLVRRSSTGRTVAIATWPTLKPESQAIYP